MNNITRFADFTPEAPIGFDDVAKIEPSYFSEEDCSYELTEEQQEELEAEIRWQQLEAA